MREPLIYREEVTAVLIALADVVAELREIRRLLQDEEEKMTEEEREAWDRHIDETIRNLRELAEGRAEREWRAQQAKQSD